MIMGKIINNQELKASSPIRILIVDDDPDVLASLNDVVELEIKDCLVELASNVKQATILAQQTKFDMALLDIKLGQDSGLDLLSALKLIHPDIVCIMMTAYRDNKHTIEAVRFGANDYLYKPIKPNELIQTINRLLHIQLINREKQKSDRRFHTIFEQATQCLFLTDKNGLFIDANKLAMNEVSDSKESFKGKCLWKTSWYALSLQAQKIIQAGFAEVNKGIVFNAELTITDDSNTSYSHEIYMKPVIDTNNQVEQVIIECRDITDQKNADDEIKSLNTTLELRVKKRTFELEQSFLLLKKENIERKKAEEKANIASAAKTVFLSRMSHELRTPMNAILGFGQLLQLDQADLNEDQKESLTEIITAGKHLLSIINDVLNLAEIESGNMVIIQEVVSIDEVIKQCNAMMQPLILARNINQIDNISGKAYQLQANFIRLKQVLLNLLSNAVKYNSDNGTISLDSEIVDTHYLRIKITDSGQGLTKEEINRLFHSFERLNTEFNIEGTGIGLVISKSLVELMGGTMGVQSTLGKGSTFWVQLKLN